MSHEIAIILLLVSRLPIYFYVIYKAWKFRNSLVIISARWLGLMATAGAVGAIANAFVDIKVLVNVVGTIFSFSLFMVGFTAKELKRIKE